MTNTDQTGQPDKITCIDCGKQNVPNWDGKGRCITCARDKVLEQQPEDGELQDILTRFKRQVKGENIGAGYEQTMLELRTWADRRADRRSQAVGVDKLDYKNIRSDVVTLLSSDTTYLVPPDVDATEWYADCILGIVQNYHEKILPAIQAKITEAYEKGQRDA
jgi:hypothetical protein